LKEDDMMTKSIRIITIALAILICTVAVIIYLNDTALLTGTYDDVVNITIAAYPSETELDLGKNKDAEYIFDLLSRSDAKIVKSHEGMAFDSDFVIKIVYTDNHIDEVRPIGRQDCL